ncbi:MAG: hypothetical protein P8Z73_13190 [Desulfobacteraceae bacterium]
MRLQRRDVATVKDDFSGRWRKCPGDNVEERRLPGAIGAGNAENLTLRHLQIDIQKCLQFAEYL